MADIIDSRTRSRMMAGIRGKDTGPELTLRKALHARGFRFRLHAKGLPGRPDVVLRKHHAVIFVHGCFWHRHAGCRYTTTPATRQAFWEAKFEANIARDQRVREALLANGWRVAVVWGCALRKPEDVSAAGDMLAAWLRGVGQESEIGSIEPGRVVAGQVRSTAHGL